MTTTVCIRLMVTAALLVSPIAASAQSSSMNSAKLAENSVAAMAGSSEQPKAAPVAPQEKKICKQLPSSYSRMTKRTCLTAEQWKHVEEEAQGN